ncbi:MAG: DUF1922 domain-containing protein [Candidatus Heimdallarchaeaceae archaeon]
MYVIVRCSNKYCGRFSYCKATQKTKQCPYCNRRLNVAITKEIEVENSEQARKVVQVYNQKLGEYIEPKWMSESALDNKGDR